MVSAPRSESPSRKARRIPTRLGWGIPFLFSLGFFLVALLIPLAIGISILRYHLWDIDVLINRSLVYGSLVLLLAGFYFASVGGIRDLILAASGQNSPLAIVISTLAIAALFNPLRISF